MELASTSTLNVNIWSIIVAGKSLLVALTFFISFDSRNLKVMNRWRWLSMMKEWKTWPLCNETQISSVAVSVSMTTFYFFSFQLYISQAMNISTEKYRDSGDQIFTCDNMRFRSLTENERMRGTEEKWRGNFPLHHFINRQAKRGAHDDMRIFDARKPRFPGLSLFLSIVHSSCSLLSQFVFSFSCASALGHMRKHKTWSFSYFFWHLLHLSARTLLAMLTTNAILFDIKRNHIHVCYFPVIKFTSTANRLPFNRRRLLFTVHFFVIFRRYCYSA